MRFAVNHDVSCPMQGSSFIGYGTVMAILLLVGEGWVRRSGRSPDWWDSWVIMLWVRAALHLPIDQSTDAHYWTW